jgi:hypothetical protein
VGFVDDHRPRLRRRRLSLCEVGGTRPGHRLSRAGRNAPPGLAGRGQYAAWATPAL